MNDSSELEQKIGDVINRVLADSGRSPKALAAGDTLTGDVGLDSLDLAVMVVGLEQAVGVDPFRQGARAVQTFGELVELYRNTLNGSSS
ncbi:MAG: acyl carrier protein [Planctomycetaceae bacterium]|jgi:acyl carrier protein|nr:acyl carrier protein [Planctomycetaceae bacterium]